MGWDPLSLKSGAEQIEGAMERLVDSRISPLVEQSIQQVSAELRDVVTKAGQQIDRNISALSQEIHDHRSMTKDDILSLIDYAANQFGQAIDARVLTAKTEVSTLINEKVAMLKADLEDAAITSRKTMYTNVAISIGAALAMAAIGLVYKKISLGELDPWAVFRVALLSCATFTSVLAGLKALQRWRGMNRTKKGMAAVAVGYLGALRPNGALGLFCLSVLLLVGWWALQKYGI
jgi:hypothetical protein